MPVEQFRVVADREDEAQVELLPRRQVHVRAQREYRVEHGADPAAQRCGRIERARIRGAPAATEELAPIRLPLEDRRAPERERQRRVALAVGARAAGGAQLAGVWVPRGLD